MARKKAQPNPPAKYLRVRSSGMPAEVIRTTKKTHGLWLYKCWYGEVMGNGRFTLDDLLTWNVRWLKNKPADLQRRGRNQKKTKACQLTSR